MTTTSKKESATAKKKTTAKASKKKSSPKTGEKSTASSSKQKTQGGKKAPSPSGKKRATTKGDKSAPKRGSGKKKRQSPQSHSLSHEFQKGIIAIFLLICIVGIVAMGIDIYLTRPEDPTASSGSNEPSVSHKTVTKKEAARQRKEPPATDVEKKVSLKVHSKNNNDVKVMTYPAKGERRIFEVFDDTPVHAPETAPSTQTTKTDPAADTSPPQKTLPTPTTRPTTPSKMPMLAIIIDDIGFDPHTADALARLDLNLTMAILPATPFAEKTARMLHERGIELMLHLPMEPMEYPEVDPGPGALLSTMEPDELIAALRSNLNRLPYIKGVNNHMGSALTALSPQMHQIFTVLKKRNLFFIDSYTNKNSVCSEAAHLFQLPFARRDIFLDNIQDVSYIRQQLKKLIKRAQTQHIAIGIGHPYPATIHALEEETGNLKQQVKLVPASTVVAIPQA